MTTVDRDVYCVARERVAQIQAHEQALLAADTAKVGCPHPFCEQRDSGSQVEQQSREVADVTVQLGHQVDRVARAVGHVVRDAYDALVDGLDRGHQSARDLCGASNRHSLAPSSAAGASAARSSVGESSASAARPDVGDNTTGGAS